MEDTLQMVDNNQIAWAITLLAAAGGVWLLSRRNEGSPLSILTTKSYYPKYDMEDNEKLPLGYRSNNPLNIRYVAGQNWKGKVTPPAVGKYGTYERFRDLAHGYRAALVLLRGDGYINKGINTIRKIITKFAPAEDHNYTENYIANVSKLTGIDPDKVISRNDKDALCKIVYAMSISENGYKDADGNSLKETYGLPNMDIIYEGWRLI
jgi:hypothetical protein